MENKPVCISRTQYLENLDWAAKSYAAALREQPIPCRGCENTFAPAKLYRCYHCGSYFCPACAPAHFGKRDGRLFEALAKTVRDLVICSDTACECRDDCPHSKPHHRASECTFMHGSDAPCARCKPVEEAL